jgi:hypothetical protein
VRARARARATLTAAAVSVHGTRDCGSARQGRPRRAARCSMRPQETGCSDVCVVAAYRTSLNFKTAASIGKKVDHLGDHSRLEWLRYRNHPVSQEVSQHAAEIISCKQPRHRSDQRGMLQTEPCEAAAAVGHTSAADGRTPSRATSCAAEAAPRACRRRCGALDAEMY